MLLQASRLFSGVRPACQSGSRCGAGRCSRPVMAASGSALASLPHVAVAPELVAALLAVRRAALLTTATQGDLVSGADTAAKADASPVTVADYATQALVSASLAAACPGIPLLAEEDATELRAATPLAASQRSRVTSLVNTTWSGACGLGALSEAEVLTAIDRGSSGGGRSGTVWVLDPIDGTKGFVAGRQYAIALALVRDGAVLMGVVGCPNLGRSGDAKTVTKVCRPGDGVVFVAVAGHGAFSLPLAALDAAALAPTAPHSAAELLAQWTKHPEAHALHMAASRPLTQLRYAESSPDSACAAHGDTQAVAAALGMDVGAYPPVQMDSCAKYGVCARGDAELYLRFPPDGYREKVWDHAAGVVVFEEAGGKVTDCGGRALDFGQGRYLDMAGGIVAAPAHAHGAVLEAVRRVVSRSTLAL